MVVATIHLCNEGTSVDKTNITYVQLSVLQDYITVLKTYTRNILIRITERMVIIYTTLSQV